MRRVLVAGALALCALGAHAQTPKNPASAAQSLSCLVKGGDPPRFPTRSKMDLSIGGMRVLLKFKRPDEAPEVEVLFNSAREDMQDAAYRYLRRFRLPCLTPQDGVVTAVQEFSFSNTDRDADPLPPAPKDGEPPFCIVVPREGMLSMERPKNQSLHVVVAATFAGDGQQPPEATIIYSSGSTQMEKEVRQRLADYRMPCRKRGDAPQTFQQQFSITPVNGAFRLNRDRFSLREFLLMTRAPGKLKGHYDLNTMGCPFKVNYRLYGAGVPNEALVSGPPDPNKLPFLNWLAAMELRLDAEQANDLFGSEMQINVGCGIVDLGSEG